MSGSRASAGPAPDDLRPRHDALLVFDIDEVVLEFITPFETLLAEHGARLHVDSFKLTGNVRSISTGTALTGHELDRITLSLYETQETRQPLVPGAYEALTALGEKADIVFLTAMQPAYYAERRRLLDREGLAFPMIATERSKGAVVAELAEFWNGPVVFVDDLPPNLETVHRSVPEAALIHLMANAVFRPHLPPLPQAVYAAQDWADARGRIEAIVAGRADARWPASRGQ